MMGGGFRTGWNSAGRAVLRRALRCGAGGLLAGLLSAQALGQVRDDFFIRPPQAPGQGQPGQGQPMLPPGAATAPSGVDLLVRQGFEVKAVSRTSEKSTDYLFVLQRSGELRTCLLRLSRGANRALRRDSVCF